MGGSRSNPLHSMQYLKGPGFQDFVVVLLAGLAVGAYWSKNMHWVWTGLLATPLVFGTIPKLRLIAEMNRRMVDRRKRLLKKESKLSVVSKRIRDASTGAFRRVTSAPSLLPSCVFRVSGRALAVAEFALGVFRRSGPVAVEAPNPKAGSLLESHGFVA
jgi:hypothetical protein